MSVVNLGNGSPKRKKAKGKAVRKMTKGGSVVDPKGMRNGGEASATAGKASRSAGSANLFKNPRARRASNVDSGRNASIRNAQQMTAMARRGQQGAKKRPRTMTKGGPVKKPKG